MKTRIVGVDFGRVRVGIAIADPLRMFATPVGAFDPRTSLRKLREIHADVGLEQVVLGWPIQLDGKEGETVAHVRKFERQLQAALPGVEIVRWDERFTSKIARQAIHTAGGKRSAREKKGRLDAAAAAVLLQSFLDAQTS